MPQEHRLPRMLIRLISSIAAIHILSLVPCNATDIEAYLTTYEPSSYQGILNNIGDRGAKAIGVADGIVVASPSRENPNYWFTWTRDSALTYKFLIDHFIHGDKSLQPYIDSYVSAQVYLQNITNPSGSPDSGGLGEPKFNVDKTAFTGPWGRPQRDGPALRAAALMTYARWLLENGQLERAKDTVWPVINRDLAYVVRSWNRTGFDLWEEINGSSFFTLTAQHRALVEGSSVAMLLGDSCSGCSDAAPQIRCFLESFWTGEGINSNINVIDGRTGLDVNSILASINTFDPLANCTETSFQPCSARALANHKAVVDSFRKIYPINAGIPQNQGVAVGRYAEDVYFGGNPWYLATFAAAEQLYAALYQWSKLGSIAVTDVSLPFFTDLVPGVSTQAYTNSSPQFNTITSAVKSYADSFVAVARNYTPMLGGLAEQFSRENGTALSAADLTWSYASFLTMADRRNGIVPAFSWNASSNSQIPLTCVGSNACQVNVSFTVKVVTTYGDSIYLAGSIPSLGNWNPQNAIPLNATAYTAENPVWTAVVSVPGGESGTIEYKYIRKVPGNSNDVGSWEIIWESDPNRSFSPGIACGGTIGINDVWR